MWTRKEKETVARAFGEIEEALSCCDWSMPAAWRDAFKLEKHHCTEVNYARAIMVTEFAKGARNPMISAADLFRTRPGARDAYMVGAAFAEYCKNHANHYNNLKRMNELDRLLKLADAATETRNAVQSRRLDKIKAA